MRDILPNFLGVFGHYALREQFWVDVSNLDSLGFDSPEGYETIFINGSRQYSVSLVVDVLSDKVDSTWGPSNTFRFAFKFLLKLLN